MPLETFTVLQDALSPRGRYDVRSMGKLLNWTRDEMAQYLGVSRDTVIKGSDASKHQPKLEELAGLLLSIFDAFYGVKPHEAAPQLLGDETRPETPRALVVQRARDLAVAWINTPQPALDARRPKDLILAGKLSVVRSVIEDLVADRD